VKAVDSSVIVAAFATWHEHHELARAAVERGVRVIDHCAVESYSVLTRLPPPHRAPPNVVQEFLRLQFPELYLRLSARAHRRFVLGLADRDIIVGGAVYDALVAATAAEHQAILLSCDRRALLTYERCGARYQFIC
jgi:predicted nucleic acid-binding protein